MIRLRDARANSLNIDYIDLSWEVDVEADDFRLYSVWIRRAESAMGPYDDFVAGPLKDAFRYRDTSVNRRHRLRQYWYKIEVRRDEDDVLVSETPPFTLQPPISLEAAEMTRRFALVLKEFNGRRVVVYPVRTSGQRCLNCWDNVRRKQKSERCKECWDTTFAGGYLTPYATWIQIDPTASSAQVTEAGQNADTKTTARGLPYPPLKAGDLLIEAENKRWVVMVSTDTERLRSPVHTELQLHQLNPNDLAYSLPVQWDVEEMYASPIRALREPVSLETAHPDNRMRFGNVFELYGRPR